MNKILKDKEVEYQTHCPQCGSINVTPYDKRQEGKLGVCKYICEDCGYKLGKRIYRKRL
jgi:transposase-like protein